MTEGAAADADRQVQHAAIVEAVARHRQQRVVAAEFTNGDIGRDDRGGQGEQKSG
jgi:hypothetical protein